MEKKANENEKETRRKKISARPRCRRKGIAEETSIKNKTIRQEERREVKVTSKIVPVYNEHLCPLWMSKVKGNIT